MAYRVGCAGWSIPTVLGSAFPGSGTHLERYAQRFAAVEINSSFYRPHRPATYARWAASVPRDFRFAVKVPREITHAMRLRGTEEHLHRFTGEAENLGEKLGIYLVQLPPGLRYSDDEAGGFFALLRSLTEAPAACEPRHPSWFTPGAEEILRHFRIARVAADPPAAAGGDEPAGWKNVAYFRMHGVPEVYASEYSEPALDTLARRMREAKAQDVWCIFNNTARGFALPNALSLKARLHEG